MARQRSSDAVREKRHWGSQLTRVSMEEARCGAACPGPILAPTHDWRQVLMFGNWPNLGESTSVAAVLLLFTCSEKGEQSSDKLIIHQNWARSIFV